MDFNHSYNENNNVVDMNMDSEPVALVVQQNNYGFGSSSSIIREKGYNDDKNNKNNNDSPFECSICLYMANDPIVTCCGHLFCWPCFYRVNPNKKDGVRKCPVCKGEVKYSAITPIYVNNNVKSSNTTEEEEEKKNKWWVPPRPKAQRVESAVQPLPESSTPIPSGRRRQGSTSAASPDGSPDVVVACVAIVLAGAISVFSGILK